MVPGKYLQPSIDGVLHFGFIKPLIFRLEKFNL